MNFNIIRQNPSPLQGRILASEARTKLATQMMISRPPLSTEENLRASLLFNFLSVLIESKEETLTMSLEEWADVLECLAEFRLDDYIETL